MDKRARAPVMLSNVGDCTLFACPGAARGRARAESDRPFKPCPKSIHMRAMAGRRWALW